MKGMELIRKSPCMWGLLGACSNNVFQKFPISVPTFLEYNRIMYSSLWPGSKRKETYADLMSICCVKNRGVKVVLLSKVLSFAEKIIMSATYIHSPQTWSCQHLTIRCLWQKVLGWSDQWVQQLTSCSLILSGHSMPASTASWESC